MTLGRADCLFRFLNRNKLLVVMYHGVTTRCYDPPVWTQLPATVFRDQLEFLRKHYRIVSLSQVEEAVSGIGSLPERAALITFDDGLKNNFSTAFPILRELKLPAVIFLAVDLIGTREVFWFDELYLLLCEAVRRGICLPLSDAKATEKLRNGMIWDAYVSSAETLKRSGASYRSAMMKELRGRLAVDCDEWREDFGLLDWEEVRTMHQSGLVEFGVHTATHRILSELAETEWESEIIVPKQRLEGVLGTAIRSFCFPNGRPGVDFGMEHLDYLRDVGYSCLFSTENALYDRCGNGGRAIGRVPAGNDGTSESSYFRLNTSGAFHLVKGHGKIAELPFRRKSSDKR